MSTENHTGIVTFLSGLVILVLFGVGASLMIDRRMAHSKNAAAIGRDSFSNEQMLADLHLKVRLASDEIARRKPAAIKSAEQLDNLSRISSQNRQKIEHLQASIQQLESSIQSLETEFSDYRTHYRNRARERAIGETIGRLRTRDGRDFHETVISRVTDVGLEVRHADGFARIQFPDLPEEFHDRFQWNDRERHASLAAENEIRESLETPEDRPSPSSARPTVPSTADPGEIDTARSAVILWQARVNELESLLRTARESSRHSPRSSVPGSLETWQARTVRLENELAKAKVELASAEAKFSALRPHRHFNSGLDPLSR